MDNPISDTTYFSYFYFPELNKLLLDEYAHYYEAQSKKFIILMIPLYFQRASLAISKALVSFIFSKELNSNKIKQIAVQAMLDKKKELSQPTPKPKPRTRISYV